MLTCDVCGTQNPGYMRRCNEHYRCDDCGTREDLCTYCEGVLCGGCHTARVEQRIQDFDGDTDYTPEIICPRCGYKHTDCSEWSEGLNECADCERAFNMSRDVEVTYTTAKVEAAEPTEA